MTQDIKLQFTKHPPHDINDTVHQCTFAAGFPRKTLPPDEVPLSLKFC